MVATMAYYVMVSDDLYFHAEIFDWVVLGIYIGQRLSEFTQKTQKFPEYFVSANNKNIKRLQQIVF